MNSQQLYFILVSGFAGIALSYIKADDDTIIKNQYREDMRERIFAVEGAATLGYLRQIAHIDMTTKGEIDKEVLALLEVAESRPDRCNRNLIRKIEKLKSLPVYRGATIQSYLSYCTKLQLLACRKNYTDKLRETSKKMANARKYGVLALFTVEWSQLKKSKRTPVESINGNNLNKILMLD